MPCCCSCKLPVLLIAAAGLAVGAAIAFGYGPDDKKTDQPAKPAAAPQPKKDAKPADPKPVATDPYVLGFTMNRIEGTKEDLATYKGKVVLIVNVASQCGYTKQYAGLEKLYESKKSDGFVILGFPANEFGKQEPGTNAEIKEFCSAKFSVTFPMFEKIVVKGEGTAPLYVKLAAQPAPIGGEPKWNFTKFLVDKNGNVVARYEPKVAPDDEKLAAKIDELLKAKPQDDSKASPKQ
jgi:glutathione peroxidase